MTTATAAADVFRAIADPTRRALLDCLLRSDRSVNELVGPFKMTRPAVSQHLRILREAGLVRAKRAGRRHVYRLDPRPLRSVFEWSQRYFTDPSGHVWAVRSVITTPRPG